MISSFQLKTASATVDYHADAFRDVTREGPSDEHTFSEWGGAGAFHAGYGVGEPVTESAFRSVLEGRFGDKQISGGFNREYGSNYHKPGMDFTFSPGKTVSIVALVAGDSRVIAAHRAAVSEAMNHLESYAARYRSGAQGRDTVNSGNLIYAKFEHTTSRQQDPQLHTHVVIANATFGSDGAWHALDNRELLNLRLEADRIYAHALDGHLQQLGYKTVPGKSGPEVAGIPPEQVEAFSARRQDISAYLERIGLSVATASSNLKQVANFATRPDKQALPMSMLREMWMERARSVGLVLSRIIPQQEVQKVAKGQTRVTEEKVLSAIETHIAQTQQAVAKFEDAKKAVFDTALSIEQRKDALDQMANAAASLKPVSEKQVRKQLAESSPGMKYVSTEQVKKALDATVEKGVLSNDAEGRYVLTDAQHIRAALVDAAVEHVRQLMLDAGQKVDASVEVSALGDLKDSYNAQAPKTVGQIAHLVREHALKFAKTEEVTTAVKKAVEAGQLQSREGHISPEVDAALQRQVKVAEKGVDAMSQAQLEATEKLKLVLALPVPDSDEARTKTAANISKLVDASSAVTAGEVSNWLRDEGFKGVGFQTVQAALDQRVEAGLLTKNGARYQSAAVQGETLNAAVMDAAVSFLAEHMKNAGHSVDNMVQGLEAAKVKPTEDVAEKLYQRNQEQTPKSLPGLVMSAEALGFKIDNYEAWEKAVNQACEAGVLASDGKRYSPDLSVANLRDETTREMLKGTALENGTPLERDAAAALDAVVARMNDSLVRANELRDELTAARAASNTALEHRAEKMLAEALKQTALTPKEMFEAVREELKATGQDAAKPEVARSILKTIEGAETGSKLFINVNKLSVEPEHATDARLDAAKQERAEVWGAKVELMGALREQVKLERAAARIKQGPKPTVSKKIDIAIRDVKRAAKSISHVARNPGRSLLKLTGYASAAVPASIFNASVKASAAIASGLVDAAKAGVTHRSLEKAGDREGLVAFKAALRAQSRELQRNAGYKTLSTGEVTRMKVNLSNIVLTAGVGLVSLASETTIGATLQNAMLARMEHTKVNAMEAAVAKTLIAVGKGVGWLVNEAIVANGENFQHYMDVQRHASKYDKTVLMRQEAYKDYLKASIADREAPGAAERLETARLNLLGAAKQSLQAMDTLEKRTFKTYAKGRISQSKYKAVSLQKEELSKVITSMQTAFGREDSFKELDAAFKKYEMVAASEPAMGKEPSKEIAAAHTQLEGAARRALDFQRARVNQLQADLKNDVHGAEALKQANEVLTNLRSIHQRVMDLPDLKAERMQELRAAFGKELQQTLKGMVQLQDWKAEHQAQFIDSTARQVLKVKQSVGIIDVGRQLAKAARQFTGAMAANRDKALMVANAVKREPSPAHSNIQRHNRVMGF